MESMENIQAVKVHDGFDQIEEARPIGAHNINFDGMDEARPIGGAYNINDGFNRMEQTHIKYCDVDDCVCLWTILYLFGYVSTM